jgi:hypothetical protein
LRQAYFRTAKFWIPDKKDPDFFPPDFPRMRALRARLRAELFVSGRMVRARARFESSDENRDVNPSYSPSGLI